MIKVNLEQLLKYGLVELDDVDPGVFDSYVVKDGYVITAELEENTMGEVCCIQRVLDDEHPTHLIFLDSHGNSTHMGSDKASVRIYTEICPGDLWDTTT